MASALFPESIEVDNASIQQLELLFTVATNDLKNYIFTLNGRVITKSQIMQLRQDCHTRIQKLGNDIGNWVSSQVPYQYAQGQIDASKQQKSFGDEAAAAAIIGGVASAFKPEQSASVAVLTPKPEIFDLHNQSVDAIMQDISSSFGTSLTSMSRSVDGIISKVQSLGIRRRIAEEAQRGESVDQISKDIADLIKNSDIYALVDKSGREWTPENYAKMLVRTKLVEARNNGLMNSLTSIGRNLVQVSAHGASDACGKWESVILSIVGGSSLYPSVSDAIAGGLFHPNCKHSLNSVNDSLFPSSKKKAFSYS